MIRQRPTLGQGQRLLKRYFDNYFQREVFVPAGCATHPRGGVLVADHKADMRQYDVRLLAEYYRVEAVRDGETAMTSAPKKGSNQAFR